MAIHEYLDRILAAYSEGSSYEEVKRAKAEFFERTGKVAEGSERFESQMKSFLDWYLFDRPLEKSQLCPVKLFVIEHKNSLSEEELQVFEALAQSIHSLFELQKVRGTDIYLKDLISGEKYIVEESEISLGFSKGDVFEARLLKYKDRLVFGSSFVFHPREVRSFIAKQIKQVRYLDANHKLKLMQKLSAMRLKTDQYPHIDVKHIYTESPLF
ncbi:MAG: hypothetical protein JST16_09570 [Bdellovibrionales bacterium]|nr:hypothetical protein [Bdellovibrionales bacterium]